MQSSHKLLCSILLTINTFSVQAQDNFQPGKIVNHTGDTLFGEIHYTGWEKNPGMIRFRMEPGGNESEYTPLNIQSFFVAGEWYRSVIAEVEMSPWTVQSLERDPSYKLETDTLFLRILVDGTKSLGHFRDKTSKDLFYIGTGSGYELLLYKQFLKESAGQLSRTENAKYKGQLTLYLQDCQQIYQYLTDVKYTQKSLMTLFRKYGECTNAPLEIAIQMPSNTGHWGVYAGISFTHLVLSGESAEKYSGLDFPVSLNAPFGISYDLIFRGNQGKWSLNNELMYSAYSTAASYRSYTNPENYADYLVELGFGYLKINSMARFRYPFGDFGILTDLGVSNGFMLASSIKAAKSHYFYGTVTQDEMADFLDPRIYEIGVIAGMGGFYKRFSLEFRYESSSGFSSLTTLKSRLSRMFILAGYRFR